MAWNINASSSIHVLRATGSFMFLLSIMQPHLLRAVLFPHQLGIKICGSVHSGPLRGGAFCVRKAAGQRLGLGSRDVVMAGMPPTLPKWESKEKIKMQ